MLRRRYFAVRLSADFMPPELPMLPPPVCRHSRRRD
jgi:hypothetical protein